jgi:peptide/nickel transport system permease protein
LSTTPPTRVAGFQKGLDPRLVASAPRRGQRPQTSRLVAVAMLIVTALVVVGYPLMPGYDVFVQNLSNSLAPPFVDRAHVLGTDALGRDTLSRLALAGRVSILIAVPAVVLNMLVGVTVGFTAGYFGRAADSAIMGIADLQLSMPILILLVMVVAIVGSGPVKLAVILGLTFWVGYARVARVIAMSLKEREFVLAAKTFGASSSWIMRRHLLPQVIPQLAIMGSFNLGVIIILEAGLSYLGLGVPPPTPSWGGMILEGQDQLQTDPWLVLFPAIAIFLIVGGVQILSQHWTSEGSASPALPENRSA